MFNSVKSERIGTFCRVDNDHQGTDDYARVESPSSTGDTPVERYYKNIVEYQVDKSGNSIAPHGEAWRTVETYHEHTDLQQHIECHEGQYAVQIFENIGEKPFTAAEKECQFPVEYQSQCRGDKSE